VCRAQRHRAESPVVEALPLLFPPAAQQARAG
jgi:hypothetical protein